MASLEGALQELLEALTPSEQEQKSRKDSIRYICRRIEEAASTARIRVEPFGSSASGLCLPNSDLDLGLHGYWSSSTPLHLMPRQAKIDFLTMLDKNIWRRRLALNNKVERVLHARVPLLKFCCGQTRMECDLSVKGPDGLLKAAAFKHLAACDPAFPALYRLVKLWAGTHDINDAQQGTLNSTALMLLVVFYLQQPPAPLQQQTGQPQQPPEGQQQQSGEPGQQQAAPSQGLPVLPPLKWLLQGDGLQDLGVAQPDGPLKVVPGRLLEEDNLGLWDIPHLLKHTEVHMQRQAARWRTGRAAAAAAGGGERQLCLSDLLSGFFQFWAKHLSLWLSGESLLRANTWDACWSPGEWDKDYAFSIEDPFDRNDNPSRAVRLADNRRGARAQLIVATFQEAAAALRRYSRRAAVAGSAATGSASGAGAAAAQAATAAAAVDGQGGTPAVEGLEGVVAAVSSINLGADAPPAAADSSCEQTPDISAAAAAEGEGSSRKGARLDPQAALCVCLAQLFGAQALLRPDRPQPQAAAALPIELSAAHAAEAALRGTRQGASSVTGAGLAPFTAAFLQELRAVQKLPSVKPSEVRRWMVLRLKGGPAALALPKKTVRHAGLGPPRLLTLLKRCTQQLGLAEPQFHSKPAAGSKQQGDSSGGDAAAELDPTDEQQQQSAGALITLKLELAGGTLPPEGGGLEPVVLKAQKFVVDGCRRNDGITQASREALEWMAAHDELAPRLAALQLLDAVAAALQQQEAWVQRQQEQMQQDLAQTELQLDESSEDEEQEEQPRSSHAAGTSSKKQQQQAREQGAPVGDAADGGAAAEAAGGALQAAAEPAQGKQQGRGKANKAKHVPQPYDLLQSYMAHCGINQPLVETSSGNAAGTGKLHRAELLIPSFNLKEKKGKQHKGATTTLEAMRLEKPKRFVGYSGSCKLQAIHAAAAPAVRWMLAQPALLQRLEERGKVSAAQELLDAMSESESSKQQAELEAAWEAAHAAAQAAAAAGLILGAAEVDVLDGDVALPAAVTAVLSCCKVLGWPLPHCCSQQKDLKFSSTTTSTLLLPGGPLGEQVLGKQQWEASSCHGKAAAQGQAALAALQWLLGVEGVKERLKVAGELEAVQRSYESAQAVAELVSKAMTEAEAVAEAEQRKAQAELQEQERQRRLWQQQRQWEAEAQRHQQQPPPHQQRAQNYQQQQPQQQHHQHHRQQQGQRRHHQQQHQGAYAPPQAVGYGVGPANGYAHQYAPHYPAGPVPHSAPYYQPAAQQYPPAPGPQQQQHRDQGQWQQRGQGPQDPERQAALQQLRDMQQQHGEVAAARRRGRQAVEQL